MFAQFIAPAMTFGLSAVSIPGPLQALLINIALQDGWRRALWVVLAPPLVDIPIIIVTVFLLGQLPDGILQVIRIVGGLLLLWIAWGAYGQFRTGAGFTVDADGQESEAYTPRRALMTAMAMNAISPGPYLFWSTITGPLLLSALEQSVFYGIAFLLAFYGTFLGSLIVLAYVVGRIGGVNVRFTTYLLLLTIILLVYFGTSLIAEAFGISTWQSLIVVPLLAVFALWQGWQLHNTSTEKTEP
jgi:threonine/homoserine/homoserine lactone efflux protein